jgi:hypothetical protein
VHAERWSKVSVVLFDRQVANLDRLLADIRDRSGNVLNRASVIRALIDALFESEIDLTCATCEADLKTLLAVRPPASRKARAN